MKFFLKCNEAAEVCDKSQYKEASLLNIIMLKMHLLMCKLCRSHSKRNTKLTNAINSANIKILQTEEKQSIKTRLQQEINNEQQS